MKSILAGIPAKQVLREPFPHLIVENALPAALAELLLSEYPPVCAITRAKPHGSNERFSYYARDILDQNIVSQTWRDFVVANTGPEFLADVLRLFGDSLREHLPSVYERLMAPGSSFAIRGGERSKTGIEYADITLDCLACINTPVTDRPTPVKIAHLDNPRELFAGLLYLRPVDDDSVGGDLELYRYRAGRLPRFHGPRLVDRRYVEAVATVPYRHNTMIFFLNTFSALHGVTPRGVTGNFRYLVNFVGDVREPMWDISPYWEKPWHKILRKLRI